MNNLKKIRKQAKITQEELAKLANVPLKTVQFYEQNKGSVNKASCGNIKKIAKILSQHTLEIIKVEDLMDIEE